MYISGRERSFCFPIGLWISRLYCLCYNHCLEFVGNFLVAQYIDAVCECFHEQLGALMVLPVTCRSAVCLSGPLH